MTKNPDDKIITSLPSAQPEAPRLDMQSAANFLAGCQRLAELANVPNYQPEHDAEATQIKRELSFFVSTHAVSLVQSFLQYASILVPIQQAAASLIVPAVAKALHDYHTNSKGEASPADAK